MTDIVTHRSLLSNSTHTRRRNASETRFRAYGLGAIVIALLALLILIGSMLGNGLGAFRQTYIALEVMLPADKVDPKGNRDTAEMAGVTTFGYGALIEQAMRDAMVRTGIVTAQTRADIVGDPLRVIDDLTTKQAAGIISKEAAATLRNYVLAHPEDVGEVIRLDLLANGRIDGFFKGRVSYDSALRDSNVSPAQIDLARGLKEAGLLITKFNWAFLTAPDASDQRPEAAGLGVAILGSLYMMIVVLVLALPIGVAASIYLEEFAARNRFTDLIEVNIANLAAVPSIVFGILGLAIFINFAGLPQSAPIVGGLVLTLMTLPTIIIATRASLKAVPPSIRDAALGVGASKMQAVFHHVLPLAAPGILTGAILGLAQALGETAPLLLIGMVAFVREYPGAPPEGFFDPASALPVQIYNWTQRADPAFIERASGAIIVLMAFLLVMNVAAILLRRRFERRW